MRKSNIHFYLRGLLFVKNNLQRKWLKVGILFLFAAILNIILCKSFVPAHSARAIAACWEGGNMIWKIGSVLRKITFVLKEESND